MLHGLAMSLSLMVCVCKKKTNHPACFQLGFEVGGLDHMSVFLISHYGERIYPEEKNVPPNGTNNIFRTHF